MWLDTIVWGVRVLIRSSGAGGQMRIMAFEKVLCNLFLRLKVYPCSNFKNRKERPWKFYLIPDPR